MYQFIPILDTYHGGGQGRNRMVVEFTYMYKLPMQSVPISTNVVVSNPAHGELCSIQYYVITFVSDWRQSSKQSDVGKTLSQRYTLRSHNVILLRRHNVLLWTPQHVNTTIHTTSSQRNITTLS